MTSSGGSREAVGVFADAASLQSAVDELLAEGFPSDALSLLASEESVEAKLGHKYQKISELEDDPAAPRTRYLPVEEAERATIEAFGLLGALGATGVVAASGGALALSPCSQRE